MLVDALDRAVLAHVRRAVALAAAGVLALFRSDARAIGEHVSVGGSVVQIVNGCTGLDVGIFLASAIAVYPAPWRARARGVALAFAVAFAVNFLRVLSLCWLQTSHPGAFDLVHAYLWPAAISLACLATLLGWIRTAPAPDV